MAELVGLAASLATLLQIAGQIAQLSYAYVSDVRNAPKVQKRYLQEVSAFMDVLFRAERALVESEAIGCVPPRPASMTDAVIQECHSQLQSLQLQLEKTTRHLLWPFQSRELEKSISILSRFRSIFADFVSATNLTATTATYKKIEIMSIQQDKHQLLSLLPTDSQAPRSRLNPCSGTGKRFLEHPKYTDWRDGLSTILWCCGPAGVGKSHLASLAIEDLQKSGQTRPIILFFFADFPARDRQTTVSIFQSLLYQVVEQGDNEIVKKVKEATNDGLSSLRELDGISSIIEDACSANATYVILDAPDELNQPDELFIRLRALNLDSCKFLIMSREMPEVKRRFESAVRLDIESNLEDIRIYVQSRFGNSEFSEELKNCTDLVDRVVLASGESFLLAKLIVDQMLECTTVRKMRMSLEAPPRTIEEAYKEDLLRIDAQPNAKRSLARRLLRWITYTKRRLTIDEIIEAFAVEEDLDEIDPENRIPEGRLLSTCVGLVVVDPVDHTVGLTHTTAYEFFRNHCGKLDEANKDIGRTLILYLSLKPFQAGPCSTACELRQRFKTMCFLDYSVHFLGSHVSPLSAEAGLASLATTLLESASLRASLFQALQFRPNLPDELAEEFLQAIPTGVTALHVAACLDLKKVASELLKVGESVAALDSQRWTPLHYACSMGHEEVAKLLVHDGSTLDLQDSEGWTPLFWASFTGSTGIVRLLLDNGANHLIQSKLGCTALHWAVSRAEEDVVAMLLHHHRSRKRLIQTPEMLVARLSYAEAVDYANTSWPENPISAIEIAADSHNTRIFDALTEHCTESGDLWDETFNKLWAEQKFSNPVSNPWRTLTKGEQLREDELRNMFRVVSGKASAHMSIHVPNALPEQTVWKSKLLLSAINEGQLTAARLLIESGADVNFNCNTTPLHASIFQRDPSFAQMLLQKGADTSVLDQRGYTALHHAVMNGYPAIVQLLVDTGADVNAKVHSSVPQRLWSGRTYVTEAMDDRYEGWRLKAASKTPLILACGTVLLKSAPIASTPHVINILLSKGADPNIQDNDGLTPLHYAATGPDTSIISDLLSMGANPSLVDNGWRSPLHYLAKFAKLDQPAHVIQNAIDCMLSASNQVDKATFINLKACVPGDGTSLGCVENVEGLRLPTFAHWQPKDAGTTPMILALEHGRWTVFDVLSRNGGVLASTVSLEHILFDAIRNLQVDGVPQLLSLGVQPPPSAILDLTLAIASRQYQSLELRRPCESVLSQRTRFLKKSWSTSLGVSSVAAFNTILPHLVNAGGVSIDWQEQESGTAAVHLAALMDGNTGILQTLLDYGADPTLELQEGLDATMLAALYQNKTQMRELLAHLSTHSKSDHWTAHLTDHDISVHDYDLLCRALQMQGVLERRYIVGGTLLHLAAERNNFQLVESLLSCGAKKYTINDEGFSPLHYAAMAEAWDVVDLLWPGSIVEGGLVQIGLPAYGNFGDTTTVAHQRESGERMTLLHSAVEANKPQMVAELLGNGTPVDAECERPYKSSGTSLYLAASMGHSELVSMLLARGAKAGWSNKHGWSPIHIAALNGHYEIVRNLITAGADIHATTYHWGVSQTYPSGVYRGNDWRGTSLHLAALQGHVDIVQLLLHHGADVNANTRIHGSSYYADGRVVGLSCGPTALHNALSTGRLHGRMGTCLDRNRLLVARMLISAGADVSGVGDYLSVKNVLRFEGFEDVWDAVRVGITENGRVL